MTFIKDAQAIEKKVKSLKGKVIDIEKKDALIVEIMDIQADQSMEFFSQLIDIVSELEVKQEEVEEIPEELEDEPKIEEEKEKPVREINNDMTVKELKAVAREMGLKGYSALKEDELIDLIKSNQK